MMTAAILSDNIHSAARIYKETRFVEGCRCDIYLCNSTRLSPAMYLLRQCIRLLLCKTMMFPILGLFLRGRVRFLVKGLRSEKMLDKLRRKRYDIGLHDAAVIYKTNMIDCFKRGILNSHIGLLPRYRGRCVMEWSIYEGSPTGITVFYIDEGIDTGKNIVIREEVSVKDCPDIISAKTKLFSLAGKFYAKALRSEIEGNGYMINEGESPRYYVMSKKLLAEIERTHFQRIKVKGGDK